MRRIGRTWYRLLPDGSVGAVYADLASSPFANVPGLPVGGERRWIPPAVQSLDEDARRREEARQRRVEDAFWRAKERIRDEWIFNVEPEGEETEHEALVRKVQALVDRGATEGERAAARAAMERLRAR